MTTGDCVITPDYLGTAGVSLLRGRAFTEDDNVNAPRVVLVNQEFVHKYLHDQDPLATRIRLEVIGAPSQWSQIVGVVSNVKWYSESRARNRSLRIFSAAPRTILLAHASNRFRP
jgi:hypothetical protein